MTSRSLDRLEELVRIAAAVRADEARIDARAAAGRPRFSWEVPLRPVRSAVARLKLIDHLDRGGSFPFLVRK